MISHKQIRLWLSKATFLHFKKRDQFSIQQSNWSRVLPMSLIYFLRNRAELGTIYYATVALLHLVCLIFFFFFFKILFFFLEIQKVDLFSLQTWIASQSAIQNRSTI